MARLARAEIFDPEEIALHPIGKTVRSCCLMGVDERSGKNFDHRKLRSWNDLASSRRFGQPWLRDFGRAFMNVAGTAKSVSEARSRRIHRKFYRARV